jgi:hypothetical protein
MYSQEQSLFGVIILHYTTLLKVLIPNICHLFLEVLNFQCMCHIFFGLFYLGVLVGDSEVCEIIIIQFKFAIFFSIRESS